MLSVEFVYHTVIYTDKVPGTVYKVIRCSPRPSARVLLSLCLHALPPSGHLGRRRRGDHTAFLAAASKLVAETLGKSEQYVTVRCEAGVRNMLFAGTAEPSAQCAPASGASPEVNAKLSSASRGCFKPTLPWSPTATTSFDLARHNCGWSGRTFA